MARDRAGAVLLGELALLLTREVLAAALVVALFLGDMMAFLVRCQSKNKKLRSAEHRNKNQELVKWGVK